MWQVSRIIKASSLSEKARERALNLNIGYVLSGVSFMSDNGGFEINLVIGDGGLIPAVVDELKKILESEKYKFVVTRNGNILNVKW